VTERSFTNGAGVMEYRGRQYLILRGSEPNLWKWSVQLYGKITASGEATSREDAITKVALIVDRALATPPTIH
jgi:hypothetical protein